MRKVKKTKNKKKAPRNNTSLAKESLQNRIHADYIALDPRLKILYFIPHLPQDLSEASPFGMYTPGLHDSARMILFASTLPADIREPFSLPKNVLHFRLRRLIWPKVLPIQIDALQEISKQNIASLFRVILTDDEKIAAAVDKLSFSDSIPFLHISSVPGNCRLTATEYSLDHLINFIYEITDLLSKGKLKLPDINRIKESILLQNKFTPTLIQLPQSFHNVTTPNESALKAFGKYFENEDPIAPEAFSELRPEPMRYIDRICLSADVVNYERNKLIDQIPIGLKNYNLIISVSNIPWGKNQNWRKRIGKLKGLNQIAYRTCLKNAVQQNTYFDDLPKQNNSQIINNKFFKVLMGSRAGDQLCFTSGLTLLSTATMVPVLRLEPKLNQVRGELKMLANCVRSNSRIRSQVKQSRLAKVMAKRMRELIDGKYLELIDKSASPTQISGIKVVSDLPLEWMPCDGLPLGLKFNLSRVPVIPGNLFLQHCNSQPVFISMYVLLDILVIRSFSDDDKLKSAVETAIKSVIKGLKNKNPKIRIVDIASREQLITELNNFKGAILIFDGHGNYENESGVGTLVIGGKAIDVWELRPYCEFPPIVIFSACDTHPLDGSHGSCANAAFTLGARTVLATTLPVHGGLAAVFIGRLILRIFEYVPLALEYRSILTWHEVISGMLRMTYASDVIRILINHGGLSLLQTALNDIQMVANQAINNQLTDWFEIYLKEISNQSNIPVVDLKKMVTEWASITDSMKYIQLGSPENVIIKQ